MSGDQANRLVSVIIPAYNAAAWIEETLASVVAQTHQALEIIVVDDGSTDTTVEIVSKIAARDPRIQLISQANAGVAAARNYGARIATSDLLAFVDADDLWAPEKIERQLIALDAAGPAAGLCYSWYALIDADSMIIWKETVPPVAGQVLERLFRANFVGNGSSALVRRKAFEDAGGFEPGLRDAGAQGCEDLLFYCRVAEHHEFAVVPEHHIGYRVTADNMSSDLARMLRSWLIVLEEMAGRHPDKRPALAIGLRHSARWATRRAVHWGQVRMLMSILRILARHNPRLALRMGVRTAPGAAIEMIRAKFRRNTAAAAPDLSERYAVGRRYNG